MKTLISFITERLKIKITKPYNGEGEDEFDIMLSEADDVMQRLNTNELHFSCAAMIDSSYPKYTDSNNQTYNIKSIKFNKNDNKIILHLQKDNIRRGKYFGVECYCIEDIMEYVGEKNFLDFYRAVIKQLSSYTKQ